MATWQQDAQSYLGAQAPAVIQFLSGIDPNYDWKYALWKTATDLNAAGEGWQDPSRGSSAAISNQVLGTAQTHDTAAPQSRSLNDNLNKLAQAQNEKIQAEQATHGSKGLLGGLGPLAQLAALIPGPQQPFLLAANAANSLSKGNLIGAGLNAFGAYSGGWGGLSGGAEAALPAGVGGIDSGSLSQILGNGAYGPGGAFAPGMVDVMGGTESAMANTAAQTGSSAYPFGIGPEPTGIGTGNTFATAGGVSDTGWGANKIPGIMGNGGALETGSTGGNMGFFDSILGSDPWGAGVADPALSVGELNVPNYTANVLDQVAPGAASATGNSAWDTALNGGAGVLSGGGGGEYLYNLLNGNASIAPGAANALKAALGLGGGGAAGASKGSNILGQITGNPLGSAFNALPFGLALMQANSQKNDIAPYIQNLNNLASQYSGNQSSYLQSLTDPYDQSTGVNRQRLMESLNQRGVAGSSFGDQAINNFDYTAGLGRADLLGKGIAQGAQTGAGINTQAINAINARNLSSNALIGAGLNASGQLFNPVQNDQFNLKNLFGVAV